VHSNTAKFASGVGLGVGSGVGGRVISSDGGVTPSGGGGGITASGAGAGVGGISPGVGAHAIVSTRSKTVTRVTATLPVLFIANLLFKPILLIYNEKIVSLLLAT